MLPSDRPPIPPPRGVAQDADEDGARAADGEKVEDVSPYGNDGGGCASSARYAGGRA